MVSANLERVYLEKVIKMSVSCPNCGSKSVDLKVKKTMYSEIVKYYECSFCRMLFIVCKHLEKINSVRI